MPFNAVRVVEGDTALTPDQGTTWGSLTDPDRRHADPQRGGDRARGARCEQAAKRLGVKPEQTDGRPTAWSAPASGAVSYGELVGGRKFALKLDHAKPATAKDPKDYKIVGKSVPRVDIPGQGDRHASPTSTTSACRACCTAAWSVRRRSAPSWKASTKARSRTSPASCGWCARAISSASWRDNEWAAIKAARELKATWSKWEGAAGAGQALGARARDQGVPRRDVTSNVGDTAGGAWRRRRKKLTATYDFAIHTHGSIGPSCAVAEFKDGKLTSWSASQATHNLRKQLAQMFAMPVENVRCIYLEGSGCYGRNGHEDAAADAAHARQARSAGRCACSGRAPTSTAGTRRARRR